MNFPIKIDKMSVEDKIGTMELLWNDLCQNADSLISPNWHGEILTQREKNISTGKEKYKNWENAKESIRKRIS